MFSQQYHQHEDTEKLKIQLKKVLLREILKTDHEDKEFFETCLIETENNGFIERETGFPCFLIGCGFRGSRHRNYYRHIKSAHPNVGSIPCNFGKKCSRRLPSVDEWKKHLNFHLKQEVQENPLPKNGLIINTPCKCDELWGYEVS